MRATPVDDFFAHDGHIRADGVMVHDMRLFQVKSPVESHYPWDYLKLVATVPGDTAFGPLANRNARWSITDLHRIEFGIPVEIIPPAFVQVIGRKGAAVFLQQIVVGCTGRAAGTCRLLRQAAALLQVAAGAGGDDVFPDRPAAARARHDMVEGQFVRGVRLPQYWQLNGRAETR